MFRCFTRKNMAFGTLVIPALTEGWIATTKQNLTPNAPGVQIHVMIDDLHCQNVKSLLLEINESNDVYRFPHKCLDGIVIRCSTEDIYIVYNYGQPETHISQWQAKKLKFAPPSIREDLMLQRFSLGSIVDEYEDKFTDWVKENCEMIEITKDNIDGTGFDEEMIGGNMLTVKGTETFTAKQQELMVELGEATGYTYEFKGGLNFD